MLDPKTTKDLEPFDAKSLIDSLMASLGISGDVIDECVNHIIESRVRRIYIRARRESEQAIAFDALGAKLAQIVNKQPMPQNVSLLRGPRLTKAPLPHGVACPCA